VAEAAERWRRELAAWAIPDEILAAAEESPWVLPHRLFAHRARVAADAPQGPSYERALEALEPPGSVLDVGPGGGAASLPLAERTTHLSGVDSDEQMLQQFAALAARRGLLCDAFLGRWPDIADQVPAADVVVCHHVLYNVPDLAEFATQLTAHARRRVVVELTVSHPLVRLNALWRHFHNVERPEGPTAEEALAVLREAGIHARAERWHRADATTYVSFDELVDMTRQRLCLPRSRAGELESVLRAMGADESHPELGFSGRDLVTAWWPGVEPDMA
jgi:SAM-dependent methyltransferase